MPLAAGVGHFSFVEPDAARAGVYCDLRNNSMLMNRPSFRTDEPLRRLFDATLRSASRVVSRRARMFKLLRHVGTKLVRHGSLLGLARTDLETLVRMVRAYAKGTYRHLPWRSLLFAVGALLYFLNPADLIPDVIAGLGFVDDIAVITAVSKAISGDLERFRAWESESKTPTRRAIRNILRPLYNRNKAN